MNDPKAQQWLTRADGLATRLKRLRGDRSGTALTKQLGWRASSKVTRIEQGEQVPTAEDIESWAKACGANATEIAELLKLADEFKNVRNLLSQRAKSGPVVAQADASALIASSTLVRTYSLDALPVILQLPEYAHAVLAESGQFISEAEIGEAVEERMRRQSLLYDRTRRFEMILDESVLHRRHGGTEVMRAQLDRLLPLSGMGNVRLGVVPFSREPAVPAVQPFAVYDDAVLADTYRGSEQVAEAELGVYTGLLQRLWDATVEGDGARKLILGAIDALDR